MNNDRDRLIDMLLREELGGDGAPDVTERCWKGVRSATRRRWIAQTLVVGAAASLVVGLFLVFRPPHYPAPVATGDYEIVEGGSLRRGATLRTQTGTAEVVLGGYCRVAMQPATIVRVDGAEKEEEIYLKSGRVECNVDGGSGSFTVRTDVGDVRVKGTRFIVRVFEEKGDEEMRHKKMVVSVLAGVVLVSSGGATAELSANESESFVVQEGRKKDPREGKKGRVIGIVTKKGRTRNFPFIEIKAFGEENARKYYPHWRGGFPAQGGGFDKKTLAIFRELKVGSRVQVEWSFQERLRVEALKVLSAPKEPKKKEREVKRGRVIGFVTRKGEIRGLGPYVEIKAPGDEEGRKYYPHWRGGFPAQGGHFDKKTMSIFRALKVGSRVQVDWSFQERLRVEALKVLSAPKN